MGGTQQFKKTLTAVERVSLRGSIRLRICGFSLQQVLSIEDILRCIDALPGFHLQGLQEISFEPWATPSQDADSFVPGGPQGKRVRGEFFQRQRRIAIYVVDDRDLALHVLLHEIGHYVFFLTINSKVKKRWVTELYPKLPSCTVYGSRNACEDFSEAYALHQLDPVLLRQRVPQKYEFMRDWVFSGHPQTMKERGLFASE